MRFPANRIRAIRAGKLTVALRPFEGRGSGFRVGHYFAIQSVDDVAHFWETLEPDQRPADGKPGDTIYRREVTLLEDCIKITGRERAVLSEVSDDIVRAAGFNELATLIDYFRADHGGPAEQRVWIFDFVHAEGVYTLEGLPDEPEGVAPSVLAAYAMENRQGDVVRHAKRQQRWERQQLALRLAALESDPTGIDRDLAGIRTRIERAEAKRRRKAA